jgi:hypothetical protein
MLRVQPTMKVLELMEHAHISRPSSFPAEWFLRCRSVGMNWEVEKLSFCGSSQSSRDPRIQKPYYGLQHLVRRKGIPPMDTEDPSAEAEHHRLVRVGDDLRNLPEPECR